MYLLGFVILFGVLVFVHELGHFLAAKLLRVRVLRFSVGFGPRIFGFTRGGTEYWVSALPLGGYVKMAGQDPTQPLAPEDAGHGYFDQAPWKRLVISVAGPLFNLVFPALVLVALTFSRVGTLVPAPVVGTVSPGWPADQAGLRPGDRILSVAAAGEAPQPVRYFEDLPGLVNPRAEQPITFQVARADGTVTSLVIRPRVQTVTRGLETVRRGLIGISPTFPESLVAPVVPGAAGPLQPFDRVVKVNGRPVANGVALMQAVAAARCAPVELDVVRDDPALPDGPPRTAAPVTLHGVPTCEGGAEGRPAFRLASIAVASFVRAVEPGSPGDSAGLRRGDAVVAANGQPIRSYSDLVERSGEFRPGVPAQLTLADGRTVTLVPGKRTVQDEDTGKQREQVVDGLRWGAALSFQAGDQLVVEKVPLRLGLGEVVVSAHHTLVGVIRIIGISIGKLLTGGMSINRMTGPIGLFQAAGQALEEGLDSYAWFLAVVSVNLALMNLLPIPVLDGGNIGQALMEMVMRRSLSMRARLVSNVVGVAFLVALMCVVCWNDLLRWAASSGLLNWLRGPGVN